MVKSCPMNGGDFEYSYTKNSMFQKETISAAKEIIDKEIAQKLDGLISKAQVDSFNLPMYLATPNEMTEIIEKNGCFKIERAEFFNPESAIKVFFSGQACALHFRAGFEGMLSKHFGSEIIDELFHRHSKKIEEFSSRLQSSSNEGTQLFLALKRK
ncbi:loganic acid O-methyltransferase-like [Hevea brasiliensis]|uniref:loganic acid O-methyltransferase-like n=1 Tax=Hevea brasiliensis TaxID=3981 RepID=UPI00260095BC|nr:loganic acid O-methyltransferase-like [Hevea brasiliensis]